MIEVSEIQHPEVEPFSSMVRKTSQLLKYLYGRTAKTILAEFGNGARSLQRLSAVSIVPGTRDVWAVGLQSDAGTTDGVLIEYYSP